MTFGTYGPRTPVHDTRMGANKTVPQLWIVLHTSEGGEGVDSAEGLSRFMTQPATATNVASYNAVFDTDRILPAVEYGVVPYAAGGGNAQGLHGCFPGKANQTRDQWLDPVSRAMIQQAARWILDVSREFSIPLIRIDYTKVALLRAGITDHHEISLAFKKSTHTDVGDGFPWDVLFSDIAALSYQPPIAPPTNPTPTSEEEMKRIGYVKHANHPAVYEQYNNGTKIWVPDDETFAVHTFLKNGGPIKVSTMPNDAWVKATGAIVGPIPAGVDGWGIPLS